MKVQQKKSIKHIIISYLLLLIFGFTFYIFYNLQNNIHDLQLRSVQYSEKISNFTLYFGNKENKGNIKKFSYEEVLLSQRDLITFIDSHFILKYKFSQTMKERISYTVNKQEEQFFYFKNELEYFGKIIYLFLLINFITMLVSPVLYYLYHRKKENTKHYFKKITYYDLSIHSIEVGTDLIELIKDESVAIMNKIKIDLNFNLKNIQESLDNGINTFSFPINHYNKNNDRINLKLKVAGQIEHKVLFVIEDTTGLLKKIKNEIDIFENSLTPYILLNNRRIIAVNHKFEHLIGKSKKHLIGSYLDHYSLSHSCLILRNEKVKWELNLFLDGNFNRKVVFSSLSPYFWGGEEKTIFIAYDIFDFNKDFEFILKFPNINLQNHDLDLLFNFILEKNKKQLSSYIGAMRPKLLSYNISSLLNIINDLEHDIQREDWSSVMLNFLKYAISIETLDEQILEAS